ncbi:copper homeostasis periplasmic binding protein CopC [Burkholderia vietnamiensis]|uniref:copper homeostasis periplasmic binding protein CopC n=1 Tax=Burkholderia vietnamiensis TaxID=60552 RepID=UPI00075D7601|nr:copper homeostasis periplasmic binding protein CopC [Burkholderia vietnamiensis]KVE51998.1 copper resistance protein CopC [Burkholderia vietnamiensis]KVE82256.1 copper resistance protein CopC [Burkholderia vietnamiensis]MDN7924088.1 copper homeostasis periplasmic binding protein CopC [Burkholderia vietnamiensis]HDR9249213.1 copper homeostasis periplasmic binding protein CopC [Burkholderia vietnamiensis]
MKTLTFRQLADLAAAGAIAIVPVAALAHGKLEGAVPASGAVVDAAPEALRLTFNEDLEPTFSTIKVTDASGTSIAKEKAKVEAANPRVMTVAVPKLASGVYAVQWAVMTSDSHKTKGTYAFKVK